MQSGKATTHAEEDVWLFALKQCCFTVEELTPQPLEHFQKPDIPAHIAEVHCKHHNATVQSKQDTLLRTVEEIIKNGVEVEDERKTNSRAKHATQQLQKVLFKHSEELRRTIQRHNERVAAEEQRKVLDRKHLEQAAQEQLRRAYEWKQHQEFLKQKAAERKALLESLRQKKEAEQLAVQEQVAAKMQKVGKAQVNKLLHLQDKSEAVGFTHYLKKGLVHHNRDKMLCEQKHHLDIQRQEQHLREQHLQLQNLLFQDVKKQQQHVKISKSNEILKRRKSIDRKRVTEVMTSIQMKNRRAEQLKKMKTEIEQGARFSVVDQQVATVKEHREQLEHQRVEHKEKLRQKEDERFYKYLLTREQQLDAKRERILLKNWDKHRQAKRMKNLLTFKRQQHMLKWVMTEEMKERNENRVKTVLQKVRDDCVRLELESRHIKDSSTALSTDSQPHYLNSMVPDIHENFFRANKDYTDQEAAYAQLIGAISDRYEQGFKPQPPSSTTETGPPRSRHRVALHEPQQPYQYHMDEEEEEEEAASSEEYEDDYDSESDGSAQSVESSKADRADTLPSPITANSPV